MRFLRAFSLSLFLCFNFSVQRVCAGVEPELYEFRAHIQGDRINEWIRGRFSVDPDELNALTFSVDYAMPKIVGLRYLGLGGLFFQTHDSSLLMIKPLDGLYAKYDLTEQNAGSSLPQRYRWLLDFTDLLSTKNEQKAIIEKQVGELSSNKRERSVSVHFANMKIKVRVSKPLKQTPIEIPSRLDSSDNILELLRKGSGITKKDRNELEQVLLIPIGSGSRFTLDPIRAGYALLNLALRDENSKQVFLVYQNFHKRIDEIPMILRHKFREDLFLYLIKPSSSVAKSIDSTFRNRVFLDYKEWALSYFDTQSINHYRKRMERNGFSEIASVLKSQNDSPKDDFNHVTPETFELAILKVFEKYSAPHGGNDPHLTKKRASKYTKKILSYGYKEPSELSSILHSIEEYLDCYDTLVRPISPEDLANLGPLFAGLQPPPSTATRAMTEKDISELIVKLKAIASLAAQNSPVQSEMDEIWKDVESTILKFNHNHCLPDCKHFITSDRMKHIEREVEKLFSSTSVLDDTKVKSRYVRVAMMISKATVYSAYDSVLKSYNRRVRKVGPHIIVDPFNYEIEFTVKEQ